MRTKGFRLILLLLVLGVMGFVKGVQELKLTLSAGTEPEAVKLLALEKGDIPDSPSLSIGEHWAVYSSLIYTYDEKILGSNEHDSATEINYAYYPIISDDHPYNKAVDKLIEKYGDEIPEGLYPEFREFTVLVKTTRFETLGDVPDFWDFNESVQGLVINSIGKLDGDERDLLKEMFPYMNIDEVLILEEGRSLSPVGMFILYFGGGFVILALGVLLIIRKILEAKKNRTDHSGFSENTTG